MENKTTKNLRFGMSNHEFDKVMSKLNNDMPADVLRAWQKVDAYYKQNLRTEDFDENEYDSLDEYYEYYCNGLDALEDAYRRYITKKYVKIERVIDYDGRVAWAFFTDTGEDNAWEFNCSYPIVTKDDMDFLHWTIINTIREFAYLGYEFIQSKEWTTLDLRTGEELGE